MTALLVTGVPIHTMDGDRPAEAMAVVDGRVHRVGTLEEIDSLGLEWTERLDLDRGAILPAFIDPHHHAYLAAMDPDDEGRVRRCRSIAELLAVVREAAAAPTRGWLRLYGYEPLELAELRSPTAAEIDTACADWPVHLITRGYHESAVNSAGLAALGLGRSAKDPPGGRLGRDWRGRPSGVLVEAASFLAESVSRAPHLEGAWRERLSRHAMRLHAHGILQIGDAAVPARVANEYVNAGSAFGLKIVPLLVGDRIDEPAIKRGYTTKVLADGGERCHLCMTGGQVVSMARASWSATFRRGAGLTRAVARRGGVPRLGPDSRFHLGHTLSTRERLDQLLRHTTDEGGQLAVHALGNGAVADVVAAWESGRWAANGGRLRIEHAMVLDPEGVARLGATGIPVVAQPGFIEAFGAQLDALPPPQPMALLPFAGMLAAGTRLAFSSDYPVADLNPWTGIAAAITREDSGGRHVSPRETITIAEALRAYTITAADVLGVAGGRLSVGVPADFVWVDRDPLRTDPRNLAGTRTLATWRSGVAVYVEQRAHDRE